MTTEIGARAAGERLTRRDVRTLSLASLGGALEFYDFVVFVFFTATIAKLFFPPDMPEWLALAQTWGLFAAGYLARPLGGIVMAHFGDLIGRKRMFVFSVFLMAVPTLLIGLMPTYATLGYAAPILLLVFRVLQGAAIGGEAPGAWVFVAEHVPPGRTGLACGMLTGGLTLGILFGSLMALVVNRSFAPEVILDWAWRIPFLAGGVFGLIAMYLRRFLEETPVFEAMRARAELARGLPLAQALRGHWRGVVLSILASWMLTAAIVVLILQAPTLLPKLYPALGPDMPFASVVATLTLTFSAVAVGAGIDRFGLRPMMAIFGIALIAAAYALFTYGADPALLLPVYALTGIAVGAVSIVPTMMVRAFPADVRFSGVSFSYNLAYAVFGAATPPLIQVLITQSPLGPAHYVTAATLVGTAAVFISARKA
ncbi:Proline/betaine transporter [Alphaproteobacteria bacterium SO-S41]|nr:Proline/betaine transporter [Alphaproteobacteria bacterium SO-S41]